MAQWFALRMSTSSTGVTYRFGEFEVDTAAYELRRMGHCVQLARQPMDLLLFLLERPQELVSRHDIAKRLWAPDVYIDLDAGIHTAILKIRQALGDSRESRIRRDRALARAIVSSPRSSSWPIPR